MRVPWLHHRTASQEEDREDQTDTEGEETEDEESEMEENKLSEVRETVGAGVGGRRLRGPTAHGVGEQLRHRVRQGSLLPGPGTWDMGHGAARFTAPPNAQPTKSSALLSADPQTTL